MARPWSEVQKSEQFQQLPAEQQAEARRQYFDTVVAPRVPAGEIDAAWQQFEAWQPAAPQGRYGEYGDAPEGFSLHSAGVTREAVRRDLREANRLPSTEETSAARAEEVRNADRAEFGRQPSFEALEAGEGPKTIEGFARSSLADNRVRALRDTPSGPILPPTEAQVQQRLDDPTFARDDRRAFLEERAGRERSWAEAAQDAVKQIALGTVQISGAPASLFDPDSDIARRSAEVADNLQAQLTPTTRARLELATTRIAEAAENGRWDEAKAVWDEYMTDPVLAQHFVVSTLPSFAAVLGPAKVAQLLVMARGGSAAAATKAAALAAGGANATLTGGDARQNAFDDLLGTYLAAGMPHAEAKQRARDESRLVAAVGMGAGWLGGKYGVEASLFATRGGLSRATAALGVLAREIGTELNEEVTPLILTNSIAARTDGRDPFKDALATAGQTVVATGPVAATGAGVTAARRDPDLTEGMQWTLPADRVAADALSPGNAQVVETPSARQQAQTELDALARQIVAEEAAEDPGSPVVTQARTIEEKRQEDAATALDDARRAGQGSDASRGAGDAPAVPGVERGDRAAARAPVGGGRADPPVGDAGRADPALGDPVDNLIADIEGRQEPFIGDATPAPGADTEPVATAAATAETPPPMLMASGRPFPSEKAAAESARQRRLDRVPVKVDGGWGLAERAATPAEAVQQAEQRTEAQPSDAQKEAGNYAKGKVTLHGQTIAIETPRGAERSGTDASGNRWSVTMPVSYGYFLGTKSSDGEHVDVFVGPNPESDQVWVVNQNRPDSQKFDEPKVMMGFDSAEAARQAYLDSFADGFGARVDGGIVGPFPAAELEARLAKMGRRKPVEGSEDQAKKGPFGPIFDGHTNDPEGAINRLMSEKRGEVVDAFLHPELGQIAFVYGDEKMGLRHIESKRGIKWVRRIPEILRNGRLERDSAGLQRAFIVQDGSPAEVAVIRLDWDSQQKTWLVTAHPDDERKWSGAGKTSRTAGAQESVQGNPSRLNPQTQSTPDDGGSPAADVAPAATPEQRIEDFGERIEGARKHYAEAYADAMREAFGLDIATEPLSKTWPAPDYDKLIANGVAPRAAALVHAMRDEIGTKPKASWKLRGWVGRVRELRDFSNDLLAGRISADDVAAEMERRLPQIAGRTALYEAVGHGQSLRGIAVTRGEYSVYDGVPHNPPRVIWTVERQAKASAFSNFPTRIASGETREAAIEAFRKRVESDQQIDEPASRQVSFDIYSYRGRPGVWIGKKLGRATVDLKRFDTAAEARQWKSENQSELERMWAAVKDVPSERRDSNDARVGADHRSGGDVTPEAFAETFGFRGVQFGNYVENARRQQDLNDAYDALIDLAGVIGVPPRALSLNGELGLAFGARGKGGKGAPSAHYEREQVVINLTKTKGAGSLAHEWFHALDNYFSRARSRPSGFVSAEPVETIAGMRPEMVAAFRGVMDAIASTKLLERSRALDLRRRDDYWGTPWEAAARSFEAYVVAKLHDQEAANDYLANIVSAEYWEAATGLQMFPENSYPYPMDSEMPAIRAAFDAFFDTVQTRETERGVELYSRAGEESGGQAISSEADLVAAFHARFPSLAPAMNRMLERGRENRPGGVVFVDAADPDAVAQEFASRTGRDPDATTQVFRSADGDVQGVYDPRSGLTFLFGPALTAESAPAVLLHEITHSQQRERIDARAMQLLASRHQAVRPVREFLDRVAERMEMAGEAGNPREAAAYIVEEAVLQGHDAGIDAADSTFATWIDRRFGRRVGDIVRSFVQMVRGWMHRHGLGAGSMTIDDLVGYAMAGVERAARGDVRMAADVRAQSVGESPAEREFSATERAYGGREAFERAREAGRTKLNYRQWVQVRTPAFKRWFGDWETARHAAILNGNPVADIRTDGVPQTGLADVRQWAARIFEQQGGIAENPDIGGVVLDERSVRSSLGHGRPSRFKYAAFAAVKDVLERGALVHRVTVDRMDSYYVSAPVKIDGKDDVVTVLVRRDMHTQRMYLHSVATKESLLNRRVSSADAGASERSGSSDAGDVESILRDALNFKGEASKVVDPRTGEPMVVYHGSAGDIVAFDRGRVRERFPYSFGFHFTSDTSEASAYADMAESDGNVTSVFLLAANPLVIETEQLTASMEADLNRAEIISRLAAAIEAGSPYDGVIINADQASEWGARNIVVFKPEQIKSAIGNRGTFEPGADDIRFSRAPTATAPAGTPPTQQGTAGAVVAAGAPPSVPSGAVFSTPAMPASRSAVALDKVVYQFQDRFADLKAIQKGIQEAGRTIRDEFNPYQAETLMHGKAAYRVNRFLADEVEPLIKLMKAAKVSVEDFNRYLHARHAQERNAAMAERNPNAAELKRLIAQADQDVQDAALDVQVAAQQGSGVGAAQRALLRAEARLSALQATRPWSGTEEQRQMLSGMSNKEAAQILSAARPVMKQLADRVDRITERTRTEMAGYGLESADAVNAMSGAYQHYVPLRRDMDESELLSSLGSAGTGLSIRGSQVQRATGSLRDVENILAHVVAQREATIVRGEKNRVAKALYGLVLEHPNPDLYAVIRPGMSEKQLRAELTAMGLDPAAVDEMARAPTTPAINEKTGLAERRVNSRYASLPNAVVLRVNGEDRVILFNRQNDRAMRLVAALRNDDSDARSGAAGFLMSRVGPITRYLSAINTQYNPIFGLTNFTRDLQGAALNLETTPIAHRRGEVVRNVGSAVRGIWNWERGDRSHEWARHYEEFLADGGATGYRDQYATIEKRALAIERLIDGRPLRDAPVIKQVLDLLSDYNTAIENGVRLSAYMAARRNGMSRDQAADLAKDVTVNFNRKGARSGFMASLYAFFNSAVQGTERTIRVLRNPKTGAVILGGGVSLGALNAAVGMLMFGDDWDEIPDFERSKHLILPLPWTEQKYVKIPYQLGYNALPNIGRHAVEMAVYRDRLGERAMSLLEETLDAFNPIGSDTLLGMAMPSAVDPFVELATNRNAFGREIAREDFSSLDPTPGHTRARDGTSAAFVETARAINWLTGGDDYEPGMLSPVPEQISYAFGVVTGGLGREIDKGVSSVEAVTQGDELPPYRVPVVSRFYGEAGGNTIIRKRYFDALRETNVAENALKGRARDDKPISDEQALLGGLARWGRRYQGWIADLQRERKRETDPAVRREIENDIVELQRQFVTLFDEMQAEAVSDPGDSRPGM